MRTLKEFKNALQVGTTWMMYHSVLNETKTRRVGIKQTNAVAFESNDPNRPNMSWLYFPKAKDISFIQNDDGTTTVRIVNDVLGGFLDYTQIKGV